jgi:hypothetical protein
MSHKHAALVAILPDLNLACLALNSGALVRGTLPREEALEVVDELSALSFALCGLNAEPTLSAISKALNDLKIHVVPLGEE